MHKNLSISRFLLFAGLGGVGTLAHYLVLVLCVQALGADPVLASVLGSCVGAFTNFLLAHHITFRSPAEMYQTAPRFFAVALSSVILNWAAMWSLVEGLALHYIVAQVISTALVLGFNYLANALWTFGGRRGL